MPPNFQRFLPIILIGALAIFVLPAIMKKHSSGPNAKTKAAQTLEAINLIDKGEQTYRTAKGRYTSHLADLIAGNKGLAADLAIGLGVQLDVSTDGQSYLAQVEGENLSLVRARNATKITAQSCLVVKSASGVKCPAAGAAATPTTTGATTTPG